MFNNLKWLPRRICLYHPETSTRDGEPIIDFEAVPSAVSVHGDKVVLTFAVHDRTLPHAPRDEYEVTVAVDIADVVVTFHRPGKADLQFEKPLFSEGVGWFFVSDQKTISPNPLSVDTLTSDSKHHLDMLLKEFSRYGVQIPKQADAATTHH